MLLSVGSEHSLAVGHCREVGYSHPLYLSKTPSDPPKLAKVRALPGGWRCEGCRFLIPCSPVLASHGAHVGIFRDKGRLMEGIWRCCDS